MNDRPSLTVGVVASPGAPAAAARRVADHLVDWLADRYPEATWDAVVEVDGLVRPPAPVEDIIDAARTRLLDRGWDLCVVLTDLPIRSGRRPLTSVASMTHGVGVLSWPALGARQTPETAARSLHRALDALVGTTARDRRERSRIRGRLAGRASLTHGDEPAHRELSGYLRLLTGMIVANQPLSLAATLTRGIAAGLATVAFALVTSDIWVLADASRWPRQTLLMVGAITFATVGLIVQHGLWEKARTPAAHDQVFLFNLVTAITVLLGFAAFYAALLAVAAGVAFALVDRSVLALALGRPVDVSDYLWLAWFIASLATFGGAIGAGFESDEEIKAAAYGTRPSGWKEMTPRDDSH